MSSERLNQALRDRIEHTFFAALYEDSETYRAALLDIFHEDVEYSDPAHELRGAQAVADMLCKVAGRIGRGNIQLHALLCSETDAMWTWTLTMRPRFIPVKIELLGSAHVQITNGKIVSHREFYDPIGSAAKKFGILGVLYRKMISAS
jgi:hypothetical protein